MLTQREESTRSGRPLTRTPWIRSPLRTMPCRMTTGVSFSTPGSARTASSEGRWTGMGFTSAELAVMRISPVIAATPSRIAWRKPEEMATARIITRKLTAIDAAATPPWNLSLRDMKGPAFTTRYGRVPPADGTSGPLPRCRRHQRRSRSCGGRHSRGSPPASGDPGWSGGPSPGP